MCLVGYYCKFIEGFSNLARPLTQLTQKGQVFVWDTSCEENFRELKKRLTTVPMLILSDPYEPFVVYCDMYKMGLCDNLKCTRGIILIMILS